MNEKDKAFKMMTKNESDLFTVKSFVEIATVYNLELKKIDAENNKTVFHNTVSNLDNLLEIASSKIKEIRKALLSEFGEVDKTRL